MNNSLNLTDNLNCFQNNASLYSECLTKYNFTWLDWTGLIIAILIVIFFIVIWWKK